MNTLTDEIFAPARPGYFGSFGGAFVPQPVGQTTVASTTGNDEDTVQADYVPGCRIDVQVSGPSSHTWFESAVPWVK